MILPGSYANGFAPRDGRPLYPELWRGCVGAWAPCLGPTGLTLRDWSGFGNHGTLTNMDAGTDWVVSGGRYSLDFDGVDDRIAFSGVNLGTVHTVSFWWRITTTDKVVIGGAFSPQTYVLYPANGQGFYYNAAGSFTLTAVANADWQSRVNHSVVTRNGTSVAWMHNGVKYSPQTLSGANNDLVLSTFGAFATGSFAFSGWLDSIGMWTRVLSDAESRLLGSRRGIANELAPRRRSSSAVQFNRRRRLLIGASS